MAEPLTWSVTLPYELGPESQVHRAVVGHVTYASLYRRLGDEFERSWFEMKRDPRPDCDWNLLAQGHITVSVIDIRKIGQSV